MIKQIQYPALWLLLAFAVGCQTFIAPETNLERLSYLEISYGVILDKATLYANEGRLSDSQKASLDKAFDSYEESRNLARVAIDIADQVSFDNQTAVMTSTLTTLRSLIAEVEQ
jgi:hypothetical protein